MDELEEGRVYGCYVVRSGDFGIRHDHPMPRPVVLMRCMEDNQIGICPISVIDDVEFLKRVPDYYVPVASPNPEVGAPRLKDDPLFDRIRMEPDPLPVNASYISLVERNDVKLAGVYYSEDDDEKEYRESFVNEEDFIRLHRLIRFVRDVVMVNTEDISRSLHDSGKGEREHHRGENGLDRTVTECGSQWESVESAIIAECGSDWDTWDADFDFDSLFSHVVLTPDLDNLDWSREGGRGFPMSVIGREVEEVMQLQPPHIATLNAQLTGTGMPQLPSIGGLPKAIDMMLESKRIAFKAGKQRGLVDKIVAPKDRLTTTRQWALDIVFGKNPCLSFLQCADKLESLGQGRAIKFPRAEVKRTAPTNLTHPLQWLRRFARSLK